jgi:hypothetical protein
LRLTRSDVEYGGWKMLSVDAFLICCGEGLKQEVGRLWWLVFLDGKHENSVLRGKFLKEFVENCWSFDGTLLSFLETSCDFIEFLL